MAATSFIDAMGILASTKFRRMSRLLVGDVLLHAGGMPPPSGCKGRKALPVSIVEAEERLVFVVDRCLPSLASGAVSTFAG